MTTKQMIARGMLELFDGRPDRWCQGALVLHGEENDEPFAWCMLGASEATCARLGLTGVDEVGFNEHVASLVGEDGIEVWNDEDGRTFAEVQALLKSIVEEP